MEACGLPPYRCLTSKPACSRACVITDIGQRYAVVTGCSKASAYGPEKKDIKSEPSSTRPAQDRKSTRLNSSHVSISYAVFCLKKKKKTRTKNNIEKKEKTRTE